jgi:hypothetical protein
MIKTIWTRAARDLLYEALVARFGPYAMWDGVQYPSDARRDEFIRFCEEFAQLVGAKSGNAVSHQIQWGIGVQSNGEHHWCGGHARTAVLNMASAFEAGFITQSDFPSIVAQGKKDRAA